MSGESARLAQALAEAGALPEAATAMAARLVRDWWGVGLAGADTAMARTVREWAGGLGASDEARWLGGGRASAAAAALANGVAAHVLELDDVHAGATLHPGAPIIAAAVAVAEREHASGAALLRAVVVGYEAALRIGEAVNPSHYRYWHPTGTVATFGAAAAAGSLLGLRASAMNHALGTAGTQAAGLWEFLHDGAMSKPLHAGKAAFNGVMAADLAARGVTGATRILEGERGFFGAASTGADPTRITAGLGRQWKIGETSFKLHACCGHTHTAIDCVLRLRGTAAGRGLKKMEIETYADGWAIVGERQPRSREQAQFSLAYVAAAAWREGAVGLRQMAPERFGPEGARDAELAALMARIEIAVNPELSAMYPGAWPARVRVQLDDGAWIHAGLEHPRGSPQAPAGEPELEDKLTALLGPRLGEAGARAWLDSFARLPQTADMASFRED